MELEMVYYYSYNLFNSINLSDSIPMSIVPQNQISKLEDIRDDLITTDDVLCRSPQWYHAYVLYAQEDKEFVDELLMRMRGKGFKVRLIIIISNSINKPGGRQPCFAYGILLGGSPKT